MPDAGCRSDWVLRAKTGWGSVAGKGATGSSVRASRTRRSDRRPSAVLGVDEAPQDHVLGVGQGLLGDAPGLVQEELGGATFGRKG